MMKKSPQNPLAKPKEKAKAGNGALIFMFISMLIFGLVYLLDHEKGAKAVHYFFHISLEIIPVLGLVFILMVLVFAFLKTSILVKYMGEGSGIKGWLIAIAAGTLSVGAIYLWFPVLKTLIEKGGKPGLVATFLYNRGIKLHWLPLMALYFGLKYVVVLTLVTVLASLLQGMIIDWVMGKKG
jgi:uncharacterized membrane protein YraQ (UPF0718 family)